MKFPKLFFVGLAAAIYISGGWLWVIADTAGTRARSVFHGKPIPWLSDLILYHPAVPFFACLVLGTYWFRLVFKKEPRTSHVLTAFSLSAAFLALLVGLVVVAISFIFVFGSVYRATQ